MGYLTYGAGGWRAHTAPYEEGKAKLAELVVCRPHTKEIDPLTVDWVYRIPKDQTPQYLVFRRVAKKPAGKILSGPMPDPRQALDREGLHQQPSRRRGR